MVNDGSRDLRRAVEILASQLPGPLRPLARLAYNYRWTWARGGAALFQELDPHRWPFSAHNPVRYLDDIAPPRLAALAGDAVLVDRIRDLAGEQDTDFARPPAAIPGLPDASAQHPIVFLCAEFGLHASLPLYAGGLGVLAGDILKEASDRAYPMAGVGLLYGEGSFHQRVDAGGWQHEYWLPVDPERLPMALVTGEDRHPLTVTVPVRDRNVTLQIWRVDVGRTPLYLLDSNRLDNVPADRWITARLYAGDRETRLAQYVVLGLGSIRALRAMGITPALVHLNEGHPAFAALELIGGGVARGLSYPEALAAARERTVFTTHTPVAAGNELYGFHEVRHALDDTPLRLGMTWEQFKELGHCGGGPEGECFGMTQFALRTSGAANAVSRRHGEVAREMWREVFPGRAAAEVPVGHVTNGVHLPTWMHPAMRALLDRHLGAGWEEHTDEPGMWDPVAGIPDEDLWELRTRMRADLVAFVRERSVLNRLGRGNPAAFAEAAARSWNADTLTIGFARRIATYKRLYLLSLDPARALALVQGTYPLQVVLAGRAHPSDEEAKRSVQRLFPLAENPSVPGRAVFLEDYDMDLAQRLVRGCDLWVNLPRPPMEASGTSGMKSALNGGLQLSVLDGWWREAYDGTNGWGIEPPPGLDAAAQDAHDADALFTLLERAVLPLFYERDARGIPHRWLTMVKASLRTAGAGFTASRMVADYMRRAGVR